MSRYIRKLGTSFYILAATLCIAFVLTSAPANAKETIKLGFIGPLSGANALIGKGAKNAFLLAIRQANKGDYPYKVVPMVLDDASKPSVGVAAALKFVNESNAVAAIGHWNSPVALATIPIFARNNMPFIIWGAISPKITAQNYTEVTRVTPTSAQENEPLIKWLVQDLCYDEIAILTTSDAYGQGNLEAVKKYAQQYGAEIVAASSLPPDTSNYKPALLKIKRKNPDVIYFGGVIGAAGLARNQMGSLGMGIPMAGISGIYDDKLIEIAGAKAAEGTIVSVPVVQKNPQLQSFYKTYEQADFNYPPGPYAKYAYDATKILLQVIRKHGVDDSMELAHAIRNIRYKGVLGVTTFNDHGQTQLEIHAEHYVVHDGEWVPYEQSPYAETTACNTVSTQPESETTQ